MVFEDNKNVGLSKLLYYAYSSDSYTDGNSFMCFTGTNSAILDYIQCIKGDNYHIILFDVVPDNYITVSLFARCVNELNSMDCTNAIIVPYPCIEFCALDAFCRGRYAEVEAIFTEQNYKMYTHNYRNRLLSHGSYEEYCKSVLHNFRGCLGVNGAFFTNDCSCKSSDGLCTKYTDRLAKAWSLVVKLPVFSRSSRNPGFNMAPADIKDILNRQYQFYYDTAGKFKKYGYLDYVEDLPLQKIQQA